MRLPAALLPALLAALLTGCAIQGDIVVDAGHGGRDAGANHPGAIAEEHATLDVARSTRDELSRLGFLPVMTRSTDRFIELDRRAQISNRQQRAIFLSIHFNSADNRGARGIEVYHSPGASRGGALAHIVERNLRSLPGVATRGVKTANFAVLRKNRQPATLIECAFLTNPQDAYLANSPVFRQQAGIAIARAAAEYYLRAYGPPPRR